MKGIIEKIKTFFSLAKTLVGYENRLRKLENTQTLLLHHSTPRLRKKWKKYINTIKEKTWKNKKKKSK